MRLGDKVSIRLVNDREHFVFRPNSIYVPFGTDPASLQVGLRKPLARRHINLERGSVAEVDPDARFVRLDDGQRFRYDKLIVATGADTYAAEVPGLTEHAATIWTTDSMLDVRRVPHLNQPRPHGISRRADRLRARRLPHRLGHELVPGQRVAPFSRRRSRSACPSLERPAAGRPEHERRAPSSSHALRPQCGGRNSSVS